MFLFFVLAGALGGVLGGMGMGGGTVLIPILTIFFDCGQHSAQAINLLSFIPMSVVAIIIHLKNKMIKFNDVIYIVVIGVVFCIIGCYVAKNIDSKMLSKFFGGFLICLSVLQIFTVIKEQK
jgi:uncharacterized membrane protein YfcA